MLQIVEFLAFYILLPLMILAVIIFDVTLIRRSSGVALKIRSLGGFIGALISVIVIFLDLSVGGLIHLPPANPIRVWEIWMSLISTVLIGFLFLLFIDFLLRRGVIPFVILFTTASSIISPYYLISLPQLRELTSLGVVGFAAGWITYFSMRISTFVFAHELGFEKDETTFDQREQKVNGNQYNAGRDIVAPESQIEVINVDTSKSGNEKATERELKKILSSIGKKYFKISVAHPKLLTKRFESPFLIQAYFEELDSEVKAKISAIIGENINEHVYETELKFGQAVKIKLYSPDIAFPEPIVKKLNSSLNSMTFLGKPLDTCQPGEHKVVLSIQDNKTGIEYQSETFSVKVVDFAFDHVSRPLLSKVSAVVLGFGSFTMFVLTILEQIDKTVGLTSGTAAGVLALAIYAGFYNLYQRVRVSTP